MTLNKTDKLRSMDKRRGSTPFPIHLQNLHRRSMPVDDRELQSTVPLVQAAELSNFTRCTSYSPGEPHRDSCVSDSSDSVISSGSDSDGHVHKVVLLGEHGVGKSSLARIFGGVEENHESDEAGNMYDRSIIVDDEEASILLYDVWEQDNSQWLREQCMRMGDAYIIVYSVTDKASFEKASELRIQLRRARQTENIPIILVGNKSDLVRSREVSRRGPCLCRGLRLQVHRDVRLLAPQRAGSVRGHRPADPPAQGQQGGERPAAGQQQAAREHRQEGQALPGPHGGPEKQEDGLPAEVEVLP